MHSRVFLLIATTWVFSACGSASGTTQGAKAAESTDELASGDPLQNYRAVHVEALTLSDEAEADLEELAADERGKVLAALRSAIEAPLSENQQLAETVGHGVASAELTITRIKRPGRFVAIVSTFTPQGLLFSMGRRAIIGKHLGVGGVEFHVRLRDSMSGAHILEATEQRAAAKSNVSRINTRSSDAWSALEDWSLELRSRLATDAPIEVASSEP
ncbi:MAG: DUF3313 family protein [Myxococcota bacterium]